jgi:hypothetical protein
VPGAATRAGIYRRCSICINARAVWPDRNIVARKSGSRRSGYACKLRFAHRHTQSRAFGPPRAAGAAWADAQCWPRAHFPGQSNILMCFGVDSNHESVNVERSMLGYRGAPPTESSFEWHTAIVEATRLNLNSTLPDQLPV